MLRLAEMLTFRAERGTAVALKAVAKAEGKLPSEIARDAIRDRIARPVATNDAPKAA